MFYCEQLRSLKYEEVCLDEYEKMSEFRWAIDSYFRLFNQDIIKTSPVGLREMQEEVKSIIVCKFPRLIVTMPLLIP